MRSVFFLVLTGCMTQASFDEQKWDAMCEKTHECWDEDDRGITEFLLSIDLGDGLPECRQEYDQEYKQDFEPDEDCEFDVDDANDCIQKLREASCSGFIEVFLSNDCTDVCD